MLRKVFLHLQYTTPTIDVAYFLHMVLFVISQNEIFKNLNDKVVINSIICTFR